jgi:hypothetical protein
VDRELDRLEGKLRAIRGTVKRAGAAFAAAKTPAVFAGHLDSAAKLQTALSRVRETTRITRDELLFDKRRNRNEREMETGKAIGEARNKPDQERKAQEEKNTPNPNQGPPAPCKSARQHLDDQTMKRFWERHPEFNKQTNEGLFRSDSLPRFQGSERQAETILDARHRIAERKRREQEIRERMRRGSQTPAQREREDLDAMPAQGNLTPDRAQASFVVSNAAPHRKRYSEDAFHGHRGAGGAFGEEGMFGFGGPRPAAGSGVHGLEEFARMTQAGARNQNDYQRKLLGNSDTAARSLLRIEQLLDRFDATAAIGGAGA